MDATCRCRFDVPWHKRTPQPGDGTGEAGAAPVHRTTYPRRVLQPTYPIDTARLRLRPWTADDLDAFAEQRSHPEVMRYLYDEPMTREEAAERLGRMRSVFNEPGEWVNLAVELAETSVVIGTVGINLRSDLHRQVEIGYVFSPAFSGNGYATEAAAATVDLAFDVLNAHRVLARLDARNSPSARLCERLGFRLEAHYVENEFVKGEWCDELTYAVLEPTWRRRESISR